MELDRNNFRKILIIITFSVVLYVAAQNVNFVFDWLKRFVGYFSQIITGLCIAFVLNIVMSSLEKDVLKGMKTSKKPFVRKMLRPVSITATLILTLGVIAFLFLVVLPDMGDMFSNLADNLPIFANKVANLAETKLAQFNIAVDVLPEYTIDWDKFFDTVFNFVSSSSGDLVGGAVNVTTSIVSAVVYILLSLVVAVLVLARKEDVRRFTIDLINAIVPENMAKNIYRISTLSYDAFTGFVSVQLMEAISIGILCYIGMLILRLPNAAIISIIIGLTDIIPMVGAIVGGGVATLLIMVTNFWKAVVFLIFIIIIQQIANNFIFPRLMGRKTGLPGLVVFCAVLIGGNVGGLPGTVIAVPVATVVYTLLREFIGKKPVERFNAYRKKPKPTAEKKTTEDGEKVNE